MNDLDDDALRALGVGRGAGRAAWVFLGLCVLSWAVYVFYAHQEAVAAGGAHALGFVRIAGWIPAYLFGLLAVALRRDSDQALGKAMRRQYLMLIYPFAGGPIGLIHGFRALAGFYGGGTTVYSDGAHVVHHESADTERAADRVFGGLLYFGTAVGAVLAHYYLFQAFGVDLVAEIGSDFE